MWANDGGSSWNATKCVPWWGEGMAPQGYGNIGVCGIPS